MRTQTAGSLLLPKGIYKIRCLKTKSSRKYSSAGHEKKNLESASRCFRPRSRITLPGLKVSNGSEEGTATLRDNKPQSGPALLPAPISVNHEEAEFKLIVSNWTTWLGSVPLLMATQTMGYSCSGITSISNTFSGLGSGKSKCCKKITRRLFLKYIFTSEIKITRVKH